MAEICTKTGLLDAVATGRITFTFADGTRRVWRTETHAGLTEEQFDALPEMAQRYLVHGALQKHGDSYAQNGGVADAIARFDAVNEATLAGDWTTSSATGGIWVEANARANGKALSDAQAAWGRLDKEAKKKALKALKADPATRKAKAEIDRERAEAAIERGDEAAPFDLAQFGLSDG